MKENNKFIPKNKNGSTLIWALILMLVLGILITAGLVIAQSYSNRSITQHSDKQSYYTALSATKAIAEWLDGTTSGETSTYEDQLSFIGRLRTEINNTISIPNSSPDESMGTCSSTVRLDPETQAITISSTAEYNGHTSTVDAKLKHNQVSSSQQGKEIELEEPDDANPSQLDDPDNTVGNGSSTYIWRTISLDATGKGNSFSTALYNAKSGGPSWNAQLYRLNPSKNNPNTDIYIKLLNYNDPRDMLICSGGSPPRSLLGTAKTPQGTTTLGFDNGIKPYKTLLIYTDVDSNGNNNQRLRAPMDRIVISPQLKSYIVTTILTTYLDDYTSSVYHNVRIQINDTGSEYSGQNGTLSLLKGLTLTGNSSIYTRRPTEVSAIYSNNGYGSDNNNNTNFVLNGNFVVADNTTNFLNGATINGDVIIKKTTTPNGTLNMQNGSLVSGTNKTIYIQDGGILNLQPGCTVNADIQVAPGGTLNIGGGTITGDIYAVKGTTDSKIAKVNITSSFMLNGTRQNPGEVNEFMGGIFIDGAEGKAGGAHLTYTSGTMSTTSSSKIHLLPGSKLTGSLPNSVRCTGSTNLCDHFVTQFNVDKWAISGFSAGS